MAVDTTSEEYRLACEARQWLEWGYTRRSEVDRLMERIAAQRGQAAAERLRHAMRDEWAKMKGEL